MGSLESTGKTIALIGAVIALVLSILSLFGLTVRELLGISISFDLGFGSSTGVLRIVFAFILLLIASGRITLTETIVLGIVVIIFGVLIGNLGGLLAVIGGILIILDILTKA